VRLKYAHAANYFAGIDLNPDDIINLADHYSRSFSAHYPPPSGADTEPPPGGQEHNGDPIKSDADDNSTGTNSHIEGTASNPATSDLKLLFFESAAAETVKLPLKDDISGTLDLLYYGPFGFGTPSQVLTVDVDTGSADLWVPLNCKNCHGHQFSAGRSSTFRSSNQAFSVAYVRCCQSWCYQALLTDR
jgi:Eukaryotic aspartyl protease